MFFPSSTPKVALGGKTQQKDRQQILEASRLARADRQRKKAEQQASTRMQARPATICCFVFDNFYLAQVCGETCVILYRSERPDKYRNIA